jgi:hypothetical protein
MAIAIERLQPLGMDQRGGEALGDIGGDVIAAHRDLRRVQHLAFGKHGEGGGAAAHVNHGGAQLALIAHQGGKTRGQRRRDQPGNVQFAPREAG